MKDEKKQKPKKNLYISVLKKSCWLLISIVISLIIVWLLLYKPAGYISAKNNTADSRQKQLSTNLTNRLLPELYNGVQRAEPFDMTLNEADLNEIIAQSSWPRHSGGFIFYTPNATLSIDTIGLMSTVVLVKGKIELVVILQAKPALNENGLLNFNIAEVKIGALNITPLAAYIAKKTYQKHQPDYIDHNDFRSIIADSVFQNKPFEPVFKVKNKKVRIEKINIDTGKLTLRFSPIPD